MCDAQTVKISVCVCVCLCALRACVQSDAEKGYIVMPLPMGHLDLYMVR